MRDADSYINNAGIIMQGPTHYMNGHLKDYFICLDKKVPVGFIWVVQNDIKQAVDHEFRNRCIATFMMNEISILYPEAHAKIQTPTVASTALFESAAHERDFYIYRKVDSLA